MIKGNTDHKRLDYIDLLKGISIISIVLLHYEDGIFTKGVDIYIGLFMITAFYVTSGWLHGLNASSSIDIKDFLRKRVKSIWIPYLCFTCIILFFDVLLVFSGQMSLSILLRDIYKALVLRGIGTLWFLPVLFFGELLFVIIQKQKLKWVYYFAGLSAYLLLNHIGSLSVIATLDFSAQKIVLAPVFVIQNSLIACGVISLAFLMAKIVKNHKINKTVFFLGGIMISVLGGVIGIISFSQLFYFKDVAIFFASFLEPLGLLFIAISVCRKGLLFEKYFMYWGRNSLVLMLTHYSIMMELCIIANRYIFHSAVLSGWSSLMFFLITMILQYPIAELINRKASFLLGK